jgi:hypothetical protein
MGARHLRLGHVVEPGAARLVPAGLVHHVGHWVHSVPEDGSHDKALFARASRCTSV